MKHFFYTLLLILIVAKTVNAFVPSSETLSGVWAEDPLHYDTKAPSIAPEREFTFPSLQHGEGWTGVLNTVNEAPHRAVGQGPRVAESAAERNLQEVTGDLISDNSSFLGVLPQSLLHVSTQQEAGPAEEVDTEAGCDDDCPWHADIPLVFALHNALPNPARGMTSIAFDVPAGAPAVSIDILDVTGRLTATITNEPFGPGVHTVRWNGKDNRGRAVAPGLYFVRMQASDFTGVTKVIQVR